MHQISVAVRHRIECAGIDRGTWCVLGHDIADAYVAEGFDFSGTRHFDERTGYRSQSFLTVPMKNHENEIIGVLQLINALHPESGCVVEFSKADQRLAESLASQAAIALSNRQLVHQLEVLFESFIKLINLAIDDKSPYTGAHCQRVPALTMMLAEAANTSREGPLAGFVLEAELRGIVGDAPVRSGLCATLKCCASAISYSAAAWTMPSYWMITVS